MGGNVVQMQGTLNSSHPYSAGVVKRTVMARVFVCPVNSATR